MIALYKAVCAFFVGFFTKTGLMAGKSSDIPLNVVLVTSARSDIWARKELLEVKVESMKLDALETAVDNHLQSPEYMEQVNGEAKEYIESI